MPVNLDALLRYDTIDRCLQGRFCTWTWEDLSAACFEALDEIRYRNNKIGASKRTVGNNTDIMRSDIFGYMVETKLQVAECDDAQRVIARITYPYNYNYLI